MNSEEVMCGFATDYKLNAPALICFRFYAILTTHSFFVTKYSFSSLYYKLVVML